MVLSEILFVSFIFLSVESEVLTFGKKYDVNSGFRPNGVGQIPDGFVFAGSQYPENYGHFVRVDEYGNLITSKVFRNGSVWLDGLIVSDGFVWVVGFDFISPESGTLYKFDYDGNIVKSLKFLDGSYQDPLSIKTTSDGGFIIAGRDYDSSANAFVYKLDSDLQVEWSNIVGNGSFDVFFNDVSPINGGVDGYVVTGEFETTPIKMIYAKFQSDGVLLWVKTFDDLLNDFGADNFGYSIQAFDDGTFIVCGSCSIFADANIGMMDNSGTMIWGIRIANTPAYSVAVDSDKNVCGVGYDGAPSGGIETRISCLNSSGDFTTSVEFDYVLVSSLVTIANLDGGRGFISIVPADDGYTYIEKTDLPNGEWCSDDTGASSFTPIGDGTPSGFTDITSDVFSTLRGSEVQLTISTEPIGEESIVGSDYDDSDCWECPENYECLNGGTEVLYNCSCDCTGAEECLNGGVISVLEDCSCDCSETEGYTGEQCEIDPNDEDFHSGTFFSWGMIKWILF